MTKAKTTTTKTVTKKTTVKKAPAKPTAAALAKRLFEMAHGEDIDKFIKKPKLLKAGGIRPSDVSVAVVRHARALQKEAAEQLTKQLAKESRRKTPTKRQSDTTNKLPDKVSNGQARKTNQMQVEKDRKKRLGVFRFCTLESPYGCPCKDSGGPGNKAGRLMHAADGLNMTMLAPDWVRRQDDLMKRAGLKPADITHELLAQARGMSNLWSMRLHERIEAYNKQVDALNAKNGYGPCEDETPVEKLNRKEEKKAKRLIRKAERKAEKKAPKEKVEVERDRFTNRVGSQAAAINALFKDKPLTPEDAAKKTGYTVSRVKNHFKFLAERKFIKLVKGAWVVCTAKKGSK